MKKLWLLLIIPVVALAALLVYQNMPQKRFARHMIQARLYAKELNYTAAQLEYEIAYNITGKYSPTVSLEVLQLMNHKALDDRKPEVALANTKAFVKEHPTNKPGRIILAQLSFQAGDFETAFESLNSAIAADPDDFPARLLLTQVRTIQGRLDLAEEQLRYLCRKFPDSLQAVLPLAENLIKQGKIAEGRGFILGVLKDHPKNSSAHLLLVDSYLLEKNGDSVRAALEDWQRQSDQGMAVPIAVRRARYLAISGDIPAAERILSLYRLPTEQNMPALMELALVQVVKGRFDSALQIYSSVAEANPQMRPTTMRMRVYLHLRNGNPAKALEEALDGRMQNKTAESLPLLVAAYVAMEQGEKADALIEAQPDTLKTALKNLKAQWEPGRDFIGQWALAEYYGLNRQDYWMLLATQELNRKWPLNPLAASMLAGQLATMHRYAAAAKMIENLPASYKQKNDMLLAMYVRTGERLKARALAEKMIAANPNQRGINGLLADLAWSEGQKEKGIAHFEKELALDPDNIVALNNLAWEFGIERGDLAKAAPYLDRLRALKTPDARVWDTMGWVLVRNGKVTEGAGYIKGALNLVPDFPAYMYHMGWILAKQGDKQGARRLVQGALDSKLPFDDRKSAQDLIARL
jgi:Tfp pilus assembly protein PilF